MLWPVIGEELMSLLGTYRLFSGFGAESDTISLLFAFSSSRKGNRESLRDRRRYRIVCLCSFMGIKEEVDMERKGINLF